MAAHLNSTPATERGDMSLAQVPSLDFSIVQPFASPSKNPAEDLRTRMRGMRTGPLSQPPMRTPRVRNALLDKRNPAGPAKQEFTPLLRSAKRKELMRKSIAEEKENMLGDVLETPAGFRSSYGVENTELPVSSSMIEDESLLGGTSVLPERIVSSSMLSVTPVPTMHRNGEVAVLEQGNVLSLRDQEAKLDQIQKDNFGLKLKIHFLEEALRKTGSEYHQATLKENAELKTEKLTAEADLRKQKKRMHGVEIELEESRQKYAELSQNLKSKHGSDQLLNKQHEEDMTRLRRQADEVERLAAQRLQELEDMRDELRQAQDNQQSSDEVQALKDDMEDLERELRDRDAQIDAKTEELEALQADMRQQGTNSDEVDHLKQDLAEMEAELKDKDEQLDAKDEKIIELQEEVSNMPEREKSTKKLRQDVADLELRLRDKEQDLDDVKEQLDSVQRTLKTTKAETDADIEDRDDEIEELAAKIEILQTERGNAKQLEESLRSAEQDLLGKDGEIRALEERLQTARGSWDAEAQHADARLHERDRAIQDRDSQLREKSLIIEQRDDELDDLQKRLRIAERRHEESTHAESGKVKLLHEQIRELESAASYKDSEMKRKLKEREDQLEERAAEIRHLHRRVDSLKGVDNGDLKAKVAEIEQLEASRRSLTTKNDDQARRIRELESKLRTAETPSRKDALQREHARQLEAVQASMRKLEKEKSAELAGLETEINRVEKDNLRMKSEVEQLAKLQSQVDDLLLDKQELQQKVDRANERIREADGDQSVIGHQSDELSQGRAKITELEDELDQLQSDMRRQQMQAKADIEKMLAAADAKHSQARQALEDEIMVLEEGLDEADAKRQALSTEIARLEEDVKTAQQAKETGTPARERNGLRIKLRDIEKERDQLRTRSSQAEQKCSTLQDKIVVLQEQIITLQQEVDNAREEKTLADERADLHELVKRAKIEAEELQIKLAEREKKVTASSKRESELRGQIDAAQLQVDDLQTKISTHIAREKELRAQMAESRDARSQMQDLEMQLGDRNTSSQGHARREAELRIQLRDAKVALESIQNELAEKEDRILALMKREHSLRERLKRSKVDSDETLQAHFDNMQAQLIEADGDIESLQRQVLERDQMLSKSQKKELDLRQKIKKLQSLPDQADGTAHRKEVLGLTKQIELLSKNVERQQRFRQDLVYTKQWFLMQVAMYNECNQADLRLLEDMGVVSDQTIREKRPTLRGAGLAIIAAMRMQRMSDEWACAKKSQRELVQKLAKPGKRRLV